MLLIDSEAVSQRYILDKSGDSDGDGAVSHSSSELRDRNIGIGGLRRCTQCRLGDADVAAMLRRALAAEPAPDWPLHHPT